MEAFINATCCISHYNTVDEDYFFNDAEKFMREPFLEVTPADYKKYIAANTLRRTSHILKMGITGGLICLERAGLQTPDAIITGTAMGCFEDTDKFLRSIHENEEKMLTPTPFIQSTHNTIAGQLALITHCTGYNFTYVHQNLSFESAVLDALMMTAEQNERKILVGGIDELNEPLKDLFSTSGRTRQENFSPVWQPGKGYVTGQGSVFMLLSGQKNEQTLAKIKGVRTIVEIQHQKDLQKKLENFLADHHLTLNDIDAVLSGHCGDESLDGNLNGALERYNGSIVYFKNLCGEYFTAGAFAAWLAARMIKRQEIPNGVNEQGHQAKSLRNCLVINQYLDQNYSFMLISSC